MPIPRADLQGDDGRSPFQEKPVRADIFVAWRFKNESSSVGAASWRPSARIMPPRRGLNLVWVAVLQRCRAYGATAGRGRRSRVWRARAFAFRQRANVAQALGYDAARGFFSAIIKNRRDHFPNL
jgi:hypothetical protein